MGAALDRLGAQACERIFGELVELTGKSAGDAIGAACPWHNERTPGGFWYSPEKDMARCYSCGEGGDLIDVYCAVKGYQRGDSEGFCAFMATYAKGTVRAERQRPAKAVREWTARESVPVAGSWVNGATAWVEKCAARLRPTDLEQLAGWGITPEAAAASRIGVQPEDRFVKFTEWGLPYAENARGHERCIHLPAGLVFPVFGLDGGLRRVKVRLAAPKPDEPKYKAIVGGTSCYGIWGTPDLRVWVVVETERDAMMLRHIFELHGIGAMAVGSAAIPPDAEAHALLQRAECILNALDNDVAGAAASWGFDPDSGRFAWNMTYPHAIRWPVPAAYGKDPADLVGKMSVTDWLLAGLPPHVRRVCEARFCEAYARQEAARTPADEAVF